MNTSDYYQKNKTKLIAYQKEYRAKNKALVIAKVRAKRTERLLEAIKILGSRCNSCQHVYDPCVYDFHHSNPALKDFTIGENMLVGKKRFYEEVAKCILLCANCHRLEHYKEKNRDG